MTSARLRVGLLMLLAAAALLRLGLFVVVHPILEPDSHSYQDLARRLLTGDLAGDDGLRTPGYPLLLLAAGLHLRAVVLYQILMGLGIVWLMVKLGERLGLTTPLSLTAAAIYAFFVQFVVFEFFIMAETLAILLVTAAFFLFIHLIYQKEARTWHNLLAMGLLAAAAAWTRPIYLLLPGYLLAAAHLCLPGAWNATRLQAMRHSLLFLLPAAMLAGGWCLVQAAHGRGFTYATGRGFGVLEVVGDYLDVQRQEGPREVIARTYLAQRERNRQAGAPEEDSIWEVIGELKEATGLSVKQLSDLTWEIGLEIIVQRPGAYLKQVALSWGRFWLPPGQRMRHPYEDFFRGLPPPLATELVAVIKTVTVAQRKFLGLWELLFLAAPFLLVWRKIRARLRGELVTALMVVWLFILGKSLAIALIEGGEGRFALPTFPVLICLTFAFYHRLLRPVPDFPVQN
jgi:hypothetical protein